MGSLRTRNLRHLLSKLNSVEFYRCPGERRGTLYFATSIEFYPNEIGAFKYLLRREIVARKNHAKKEGTRPNEVETRDGGLSNILRAPAHEGLLLADADSIVLVEAPLQPRF